MQTILGRFTDDTRVRPAIDALLAANFDNAEVRHAGEHRVAMHAGDAVVCVQARDLLADDAAAILREHGALRVDRFDHQGEDAWVPRS